MFSTKEPILILFEQIEKEDHAERILFYEENTEFIFALDEPKQYYFTYHYIQSLFAVEKFDNVLSEIDAVIEYVFLHNVNYITGRTYEGLLFMKATSYYEMLRYEEAKHIGEQLVGMHPHDKRYRKFMERSYRAYYNFTSSAIRLTALILIFCSAIVSAIIWFINNRGVEQSLAQSFFVVISPCFLALALLGGAHLFNYFRSIRSTDQLVETKRQKKEQSSLF